MHFALKIVLFALCCLIPKGGGKEESLLAQKPVHIRFVFGGDVMQHLPQVEAARRAAAEKGREGFDYSAVFGYLMPYFERADFAVVNLETTLTRTNHYTGYPMFRSPVALADVLRDAGIDVAVMANNHCCDGGLTGVQTTIEELLRCHISHTGVFKDSADYKHHNPLYLTRHGVQFALLNYTYGTNGMPVPKGIRVNLIDTVRMAEDLTAVRAEKPDGIIVFLHWGIEYQRTENAEQRQLAQFLRRQGVNIIVGSHPHVVQPFEADSSHIVLYSLGNLVSNQRQRYSDGGILALIDAVKYPDGHITYALQTLPVWVSTPDYRLIPPAVGDTMALPAAYTRFRNDYKNLQ